MNLWNLRLTHEGGAAIRLDRPGQSFVFDPIVPPGDDVALVSWYDCDRSIGVEEAVKAHQKPEVVADPGVLDWLGRDQLAAHEAPCHIDGVKVDAEPYQPIPWATPTEAVRKLGAALRRPLVASQRMVRRTGLPRAGTPLIWQLTFPDGRRLLHLNNSLHSFADPAWVQMAQQRYRGADWVLCGVDYDEDAAVLEHLPAFEGKVVLVVDLVNQIRQRLGLPTRLLTPLVDKLVDQKVAAYPCTAGAAYRFE